MQGVKWPDDVRAARRSWRSARDRCSRPTNPSYGRYGAVGIAMHTKWHTFEAFLADMGPRPSGTTLDRIDGSKGYEPGNCRWATPAQQNQNRKWPRLRKLTPAGIDWLRRVHRRGVSLHDLALVTDVSLSRLSEICAQSD